MNNYTPEIIKNFAISLQRSEPHYQWLLKSGFEELAALSDVLAYHNRKALAWLKRRKCYILLAVNEALEDDKAAFDFLMRNKGEVWAASIQVCNGSEKAEAWLMRYHFPHFVFLGQVLGNMEPPQRNSWFGWIDFSTSSSSYSSDWGDFGGGTFGGGGSEGSY